MWRVWNFLVAIERVIEYCETSEYSVSDHFRNVTKMVVRFAADGMARVATRLYPLPGRCES